MKNNYMSGVLIAFLGVGVVVVLLYVKSGSDTGAAYPNKDIKFIINAGAGSGTDGICRKIISLAEKNLPVSICSVNMPGSESAIGPFQVMKSRPNGYTLGNVNYDSVITAVSQQLIPGYELDTLNVFAMNTMPGQEFQIGFPGTTALRPHFHEHRLLSPHCT